MDDSCICSDDCAAAADQSTEICRVLRLWGEGGTVTDLPGKIFKSAPLPRSTREPDRVARLYESAGKISPVGEGPLFESAECTDKGVQQYRRGFRHRSVVGVSEGDFTCGSLSFISQFPNQMHRALDSVDSACS